MKAKKVKDSLNEWKYSHTGGEEWDVNPTEKTINPIEYNDENPNEKPTLFPLKKKSNDNTKQNQMRAVGNVMQSIGNVMSINPEQISSLIRPPEEKFKTTEELKEFLDSLLKYIPQATAIAFIVFKKTMELHPYLTKKTIGFGSTPNIFMKVIEEFLKQFEELASKQ